MSESKQTPLYDIHVALGAKMVPFAGFAMPVQYAGIRQEHYTRILRYIQPQFVHVFIGGRIVESGGPELADELDANGYERFTQAVGA